MKSLYILLSMVFVASPLLAEEKRWEPRGYAYCVAYTYDFTQDERGHSIVFPDKTLHRGVIRSATIRLRDTQIQSLLSGLMKTDEEQGQTECHDPHHAFVFYDLGWKPVAWVEVCFHCSSMVANDDVRREDIDFKALERFCKRIGMPIMQDMTGYTDLWLQENKGVTRKSGGEKPMNEKDSSRDVDPK